MSADLLVHRTPVRLPADPSRVVAQLFVPGHHLAAGPAGQASGVVQHVLDLDDAEVDVALADLLTRFAGRHPDLEGTFRRHAARIGDRLSTRNSLSDQRWLLLGATFTHEYAVQAAALCNPSAVAHPDQTGVADGALRFVMAVRQIGEGHISSIGLRSGVIASTGTVTIDPPGQFVVPGVVGPGHLDAAVFRDRARRMHDDADSIDWLLDRLGDDFTLDELDGLLAELISQQDTRHHSLTTVQRLHDLASRSYTVDFPSDSGLTERVLQPASPAESGGVEDARFVRFVDADGTITYHATYTAFDGRAIAQQLLTTTDFRRFSATPLTGAAAANKGLALFPRRVGGRYAALSRHDGAHNAIAFSDNMRQWHRPRPLDDAPGSWGSVQVGNCGPPIETDDGWLVLTHGVGAMRTYRMGAMLLDLDDPTHVVARLPAPLLTPQADEQDGYVPNVVYSCGALLHRDTLMIPYGVGDASIAIATVQLPELLAAMRPTGGG